MKQAHSTTAKRSPEPVVDLYQDETMAMVYVGDVYSLVAQQGVVGEVTSQSTDADADNDRLLPFIR